MLQPRATAIRAEAGAVWMRSSSRTGWPHVPTRLMNGWGAGSERSLETGSGQQPPEQHHPQSPDTAQPQAVTRPQLTQHLSLEAPKLRAISVPNRGEKLICAVYLAGEIRRIPSTTSPTDGIERSAMGTPRCAVTVSTMRMSLISAPRAPL